MFNTNTGIRMDNNILKFEGSFSSREKVGASAARVTAVYPEVKPIAVECALDRLGNCPPPDAKHNDGDLSTGYRVLRLGGLRNGHC